MMLGLATLIEDKTIKLIRKILMKSHINALTSVLPSVTNLVSHVGLSSAFE